MASGSVDRTVKIWDPRLSESVQTFSEHERDVTSLCFLETPDLIASGSLDGTVKVALFVLEF